MCRGGTKTIFVTKQFWSGVMIPKLICTVCALVSPTKWADKLSELCEIFFQDTSQLPLWLESSSQQEIPGDMLMGSLLF